MERTHTAFAHIDIHHRFHLINNQLTSVHGTPVGFPNLITHIIKLYTVGADVSPSLEPFK